MRSVPYKTLEGSKFNVRARKKSVSDPKPLKSGFIEDIENCLDDLKFEAEISFELFSNSFSKPEDIFVLALVKLLKILGDPDFPSLHNETIDYGTHLDLDASFSAVWDFDYYCLSLTLIHKGTFKDKVLLRSHIA